METYLIYLLKASIGLILFYLFYFLLLRKETFYSSNRLYLILGLIMAVMLPAFPISYSIYTAMKSSPELFVLAEKSIGALVPIAPGGSENVSFFHDYIFILSAIYAVGACFFLFRLILQTIVVIAKLGHGKRRLLNGVSVIDINKEIMPFSFFNTVFINIKEYSKEELSNIIAHEKVHIQERHWVDLLIVELLTVVFWINPIVWLYERSIKQNHEYLADQGVLLAGYSPGQYQELLINQLMGVKILGFTNNLNYSLNKKRMEMMKKEKSPGFKKVKLLLALPIITLLAFAFAKKEYVMVNSENAPSNSNLTFEQIETQKDLIKVNGKVVNSEGIPLTGANVILKGTNNGTVVDKQGEFVLAVPKNDKPFRQITQDGGEVTVDNAQAIFISFVGYGTHVYVFNTHSNHEAIEVKIKLHKATINVTLPEIGDDEELINGAIVEIPAPQIVDDEELINGEIIEVPPPPPPLKENKKEEIFTIVEEMPYYAEGGMHQLAQDIKKQTTRVMEKTKDRGEALVGFTVTEEGKITNAHIVKSADSKMLDASAVKIVKKLNNWESGMQRGKSVKVDLTVPINFN